MNVFFIDKSHWARLIHDTFERKSTDDPYAPQSVMILGPELQEFTDELYQAFLSTQGKALVLTSSLDAVDIIGHTLKEKGQEKGNKIQVEVDRSSDPKGIRDGIYEDFTTTEGPVNVVVTCNPRTILLDAENLTHIFLCRRLGEQAARNFARRIHSLVTKTRQIMIVDYCVNHYLERAFNRFEYRDFRVHTQSSGIESSNVQLLRHIVRQEIQDEDKSDHLDAIFAPTQLYEKALVHMLKGWLYYADACKEMNDFAIGEDAIFADLWGKIGENMEYLLCGNVGRLDPSSLSHVIRSVIQNNDHKPR